MLEFFKVNTEPDTVRLGEFIDDLRNELPVDLRFREGCLLNPATRRWTDLAAHVYCSFPYEFRGCYSTTLVSARSEALTKIPVPTFSDLVEATLTGHEKAFELCVENGKDKTAIWLKAEELRKNTFRYAVWSVQGVHDFNLEAESEVINRSYAKLGIDRMRRSFDTWPKWAHSQPRYDWIRSAQRAAMSP